MSNLSTPVDASDHVRGVSGGRQLVVYGDFECPYTAATMREVARLFDAGAAFELVYRHFPLRDIHPHAEAAAEAAEAAASQGRFWEMHDLLFRNQQQLEPSDLRHYAEEVGLRPDRYEADVAAPATSERVQRDVESGLRSGVDGTPSLFIDGVRYLGRRDGESLAEAFARQ
jgi:formate-nitrite transporter family protein